MFIHIGGDTMVRLKDIIGIFDIHTLDSPESGILPPPADTNPSLPLSQTVEATENNMKSIILTDHQMYLSPISSLTLKKRATWLYREGEEGETTDLSL